LIKKTDNKPGIDSALKNSQRNSIMKTKIGIWIYHFAVIGLVLLLSSSCKEDLTNTLINIDDDQDSIFYPHVQIGTQVWMTQNLQAGRYQNTNRIRTTTPATLDITDEFTPKYQWLYDGVESNLDTYGRLYTWYAVTDSRKICPAGWHVPSDAEWFTLISMEAMGGQDFGGGKLKSKGTTFWASPNTGATNEAHFSALPGGLRFYYGRFRDIGFSGFWWSSTESSDSTANGWGMFSYSSQVSRISFNKRDGLSVRCIQDN
jgi:uncharacterized protein (TIGR02145 family)